MLLSLAAVALSGVASYRPAQTSRTNDCVSSNVAQSTERGSSPNFALVDAGHSIPSLAVERLGKLATVGQRAQHAELSRRVRVDAESTDRLGRPHVARPDLRKRCSVSVQR